MRAGYTILFSVILHACVFWAFKKIKLPDPPAPKIEVTLRERPKGNPKSNGRSKGRGLGLSKLSPKMTSLFEPGPDSGKLVDEEARGTGEWPADTWGAHQGGLLKELEVFIPMERLFYEIQGLLNYPGILGENGISGALNVRLRFTEDSKCDWSRTTVSEANHYLKFYVASLLKKICRLEFVNHMHFGRHQFADLNFRFVILDGLNNEPRLPNDAIAGNVLLFQREYNKPFGSYKIGPIQGIVFLPTAFTVDVMWFMQKWDEVMNGYDPLNEFREK